MPIQNIIFDLGGVILDLDSKRMNDRFHKLGVKDFERYFTLKEQTGFFEDLELGLITSEEFCERLRQAAEVELDDRVIEATWNLILKDFKKERMEFLENISKEYKIFLFSNTNSIHAECFEKRCVEQMGKSLESYFDAVFYSHGLHLRKPDKMAFEEVLLQAGLHAEETLFIDDNAANIYGAQKAGLQTILLQSPQTILDLKLH
jgi:epoxide hydrolase-like predicted phosphatase